MQAQTEPKLHPETANLEVEQVVTKRSANLKGDLQVNLEPKWSLRCSPWKFHASDLRPNQFSLRAALKVSYFDIFNKLISTCIHFFFLKKIIIAIPWKWPTECFKLIVGRIYR